jgi:hypothetical protein
LDILPDLPLLERITQKICRVVGRHHSNTLKLVNAIAKFGDGLLGGKQELGGKASQGQNGLRSNGPKLAPKEGTALLYFVNLGIAVSRRSALDHITNVDLSPPPSHGGNDTVEQPTGRTHKRPSQSILFLTWPFPNQNYSGCRVSFSKDNMGSIGVKLTAGTISQVDTNLLQGFRKVLDKCERLARQPFQTHHGLIVEMLAEGMRQFSQVWTR